MKTRIISGIVMALVVAGLLALGIFWQPIIITLAVALLAAGAIYELVHNAAGIEKKAAWIGACVYSAAVVIAGDTGVYSLFAVLAVTVLYAIYAVFVILKYHNEFDLGKICALYSLPIPFSIAFFCLAGIINIEDGIYYLLLLLNFSSVCDMGAYFTGVSLGKHKLCPEISPKKTVEGAVGGIVSSIIVTLIITFAFGKKVVLPLVLTVPFCVLGMVGDLFASAIKRSVGLKDYGDLIPGHGGIMDRVDSIIMIAPLMYVLMGLQII